MNRLAFFAAFLFVIPPAQAAVDAGASIYLNGILGSGKQLVASRENGAILSGRDAACVNCHRTSGLGSREGRIVVPPIAGSYLFATGGLPYSENMRLDRDTPYTETALASAIREGVDMKDRKFNYLMPKYALSDADMAALIGYLKHLDKPNPPGVSDKELSFATIITPEADPVKKKGVLDVLHQFFAAKNLVQFAPTAALRTSRKTSWARGMFMVNRNWKLHVWELKGPPATWKKQLERDFSREPVLAVLSGVGGRNWKPVHEFCEMRGVPCLFPNVEAPPAGADRDFYSIYFSRGLLLEADLLTRRIVDSGREKKVAQIYRKGSEGESAARELRENLVRHGVRVESIAVDGSLSRALRQARKSDALVMWLPPEDISRLGSAENAPRSVYMSGTMGGLEQAPLPASWRGRTSIAYPFDLPQNRIVPVDYALGWFRIRRIPVVAEQAQTDTYLASTLLSETLNEMSDNFSPEYLVERLQDNIDHRIITGYYPHLTLATGQRFASKGGYLVHFADPDGGRLVADSGWIVP